MNQEHYFKSLEKILNKLAIQKINEIFEKNNVDLKLFIKVSEVYHYENWFDFDQELDKDIFVYHIDVYFSGSEKRDLSDTIKWHIGEMFMNISTYVLKPDYGLYVNFHINEDNDNPYILNTKGDILSFTEILDVLERQINSFANKEQGD